MESGETNRVFWSTKGDFEQTNPFSHVLLGLLLLSLCLALLAEVLLDYSTSALPVVCFTWVLYLSFNPSISLWRPKRSLLHFDGEWLVVRAHHVSAEEHRMSELQEIVVDVKSRRWIFGLLKTWLQGGHPHRAIFLRFGAKLCPVELTDGLYSDQFIERLRHFLLECGAPLDASAIEKAEVEAA